MHGTKKRGYSYPMINGDDGLGELAGRLLDSYHDHGGINHIDGANLPSKQAIVLLTQDLLRLLFPGFFDQDILHSTDLDPFVRRLLEKVARNLSHEILKSLDFQPREGGGLLADGEAREITLGFLGRLPEIRALLVTDLQAAYDGDPAASSFEEIIVAYPFIEAVAVQRLAHLLYCEKIALIPRIMTEWAHSRTGIDLHPGAKIGSSFFIDHGTGVVVGETCRVGDRVKIYQGVTLGAKSFKKDAAGRIIKGSLRHPTIEDDVTIYAGATILGGDTVIGARSTISGNVWLTHSVPPDSLVVFEGQRVEVRSKPSA